MQKTVKLANYARGEKSATMLHEKFTGNKLLRLLTRDEFYNSVIDYN